MWRLQKAAFFYKTDILVERLRDETIDTVISEKNMKIYLLKDIDNVGMAGQVIKVADGYATNYILPRKLGIKVTTDNEVFLQEKMVKEHVQEQAIKSKIAMTAERLKNMHLKIKMRVHDDGKLYASVNAENIIELLKEKEITVSKKQVEFEKTIRNLGEHKVTIKLSSKLQPQLTLEVLASK